VTKDLSGSVDASYRAISRPSVASVEIDGEAVLYDEESGSTHLLNPTASIIWASLGTGFTLGELADELAEIFSADPGQVRDDVIAIARDLESKGLLEELVADSPGDGSSSPG